MKTPLTISTAEPFFYPGGPIGCLLIHGFTGTPKEMTWMGEYLHQKGHTVLGIRLAGHATQPDDMLRVRWWDWVASMEDGLNLLKGCTQFQFAMGLSMGGCLALYAASHYPIHGTVAVSAPYAVPADPRLRFIKILKYFHPREYKGSDSDFHNKEAEKIHVDYPYFPTPAVIELSNLVAEMQKGLPDVKVPVLMFQSKGDKVINADSMQQIYDHLGTADKQMNWVEDSGHVIVREPERERVFKAADEFVHRVSGI
jgi:carboxylesterase